MVVSFKLQIQNQLELSPVCRRLSFCVLAIGFNVHVKFQILESVASHSLALRERGQDLLEREESLLGARSVA